MKKISLAAILAVMLSAGLSLQTKAQTKTVSIENFNINTASTIPVNIAGTSHYDKDGQLLYVIRRYNATSLPENITSIIKNRYNNYTIAGVEEVAIPSSSSVYFVHITNDKKLKTVKVYNGNTEVINNYIKG